MLTNIKEQEEISMARPKHSIEDIVSKHYQFISDYFERGIQHQRIFKFYSDKGDEAKEDFNKLLLASNKSKEDSIIALTNWIEEHLAEDLWGRCKTALRQHNLMVIKKQKYEYKTFRIPKDLFYDITFYAEETKLSKFAAMKQAIDIASTMSN